MDVIAGPNFRRQDNALQALGVVVLTGAGLAFGVWRGGDVHFWPLPLRVPLWMIGTLAGLAAGLFLTGAVLMVYRLFRH